MAKRKYTRWGETPVAYECSKQKCKWQGSMSEKVDSRVNSSVTEKTCPKCGNNEFKGLLNKQ